MFLISVCFFWSISSFASPQKNASWFINGIHGPLLENVNKRLTELKKFKSPGEITPEELTQNTLKALEPLGYFEPKVEVSFNGGHPVIFIQPGRQIRISHINVQWTGDGENEAKLKKIIYPLPFHIGDPLITDTYTQLKQKMVNGAERLGYLRGSFTKAEVLVDKESSTAQITLIYDTGAVYYFGRVEFDPTYIKPELLRKYITFHPGQSYSTKELIQFNNTLSDSGYFNSVVAKPNMTDSQEIPISVHLEPVPKYSYTFGGGYGTDTGIRGRAGFHVIPVNPGGDQFHLLAQGSMIQNAIQAQYLIPGRNPITDQYNITGNYSNLNYSAGNSNAFQLSFAQEYKTAPFNRTLSINGLFEKFHYKAQPDNSTFVPYPKAKLAWTKRDNLTFSPSGYHITLNGLGAIRAWGSDINFVQTSLDIKAAYMIDVLRLRLYGHALQGITVTKNIKELPLSLAMLLGGPDNLKGYTYNSLGPGRTLSYAGLELQKEIIENFYVVGFYDIGDVYNPTPQAIKHDVGAGLMWVSPLGPIKIGLAQPINQRFERTTPRPQLVITMGPSL